MSGHAGVMELQRWTGATWTVAATVEYPLDEDDGVAIDADCNLDFAPGDRIRFHMRADSQLQGFGDGPWATATLHLISAGPHDDVEVYWNTA